jgi:hypothetical protein
LLLSVFIFTLPCAAGAMDEFKKLTLVAHELTEKTIITAKIPRMIFFLMLFNLVAFILFMD